MTRLRKALAGLEAEGDAVAVGLVGAGRMGRSLAVASQEVPGVDVTAIADVRPDRARAAFRAMGYGETAVEAATTADAADAAIREGRRVATTDGLLVPTLEAVDVVIGATGVPAVGAQVATRAILHGTHVVMLTDETDATVGSYLSALAQRCGVVYSGAAGDEPGAILELYDFAKSLGLEVVAAGKGKNNPLDREATPDALADTADRKGLNPEIYTAFVDGTNTMLEMTMVANATGLTVDRRGMHGPEVSGVAELAEVFSDTASGGMLSRRGVVEYALGGGVAPGVFLVVTTDSDTVRADLEYLGIGEGPNYCLHRTYHIPTLEPLLTAARAALFSDASLVPEAPVVDTVAVAKTGLEPGDEIDGIGGRTVYGLAEDAAAARAEALVPIGLVEGATVTRSLEPGAVLRADDVELRDTELRHLRALQDAYF